MYIHTKIYKEYTEINRKIDRSVVVQLFVENVFRDKNEAGFSFSIQPKPGFKQS